MSIEDEENSAGPTGSTDGKKDISESLVRIEGYLVSIRAAAWVTAVGILALVVFLVK